MKLLNLLAQTQMMLINKGNEFTNSNLIIQKLGGFLSLPNQTDNFLFPLAEY